MLTKSTARYFAKQAYRLAICNGLYGIREFQGGTVTACYHPENQTVTVDSPLANYTIKVAKAWL